MFQRFLNSFDEMPRSHSETILDKYRIHDGHAATIENERLPNFAQFKVMVESLSGDEKKPFTRMQVKDQNVEHEKSPFDFFFGFKLETPKYNNTLGYTHRRGEDAPLDLCVSIKMDFLIFAPWTRMDFYMNNFYMFN